MYSYASRSCGRLALDHCVQPDRFTQSAGEPSSIDKNTSKAVQQWLQTHERLQLVSLPSYASHKYNPTEKIWWHLKDAISANRSFKVLAELDTALRRHFASLTPQTILRLINSFVARQAQAAVAA